MAHSPLLSIQKPLFLVACAEARWPWKMLILLGWFHPFLYVIAVCRVYGVNAFSQTMFRSVWNQACSSSGQIILNQIGHFKLNRGKPCVIFRYQPFVFIWLNEIGIRWSVDTGLGLHPSQFASFCCLKYALDLTKKTSVLLTVTINTLWKWN